MPQNIVESLRQAAVDQILDMKQFAAFWPTWKAKINELTAARSNRQLYNLGDHLREIFLMTAPTGRDQSAVASAGSVWEGLVAWYLNLCLINRRTVVIKHNQQLLPSPIADAITVNYSNFPSNSESDLIAITFPDLPEYKADKDSLVVYDPDNNIVPTYTGRRNYNLKALLDALCARDFSQLEIHIIQCKTNWNDNAQIPMLWDIVYSASDFKTGVTIGTNGFSITSAKRFTYSFVTVPSQNEAKHDKLYTPSSTCVMRVKNLTGGNYWGMPTKANVASNVKEMLSRNLSTGHEKSILETLKDAKDEFDTSFSYFSL